MLRYQCFYYPAGIALLCNKVLPSSCMPLLHSSCVFLLLCIRFFFFWHSQTRELQNENILEIALNSCGADVLLPSFVHFHDFHLHHCLQVYVCMSFVILRTIDCISVVVTLFLARVTYFRSSFFYFSHSQQYTHKHIAIRSTNKL